MRATKNFGLAAAVVLALLVGFAVPASAATKSVRVESGTLTTVLGNFDLTPGSQGTPPCPEKPSTLTFTTNANNTWTAAGTFSGQFQLPPASGNWYQADFQILGVQNGTWAGAHPTNTLAGTVVVRVTITQIILASDPPGTPPNCAKTNVRCIITGAFALNTTPPGPPFSTYKSGPLNPTGLPNTVGTAFPVPVGQPDLADHVTLSGTSGPLVIASCTAPWNSVGGTTATITNLQLHVLP